MNKQFATASSVSHDLLVAAYERQLQFEDETSEASRKAKGQFFTPPAIARFMASQFSQIPKEFALLDPGAGTGALTLAVCERLLRSRTPKHLRVHLFETDDEVLPILHANMKDAEDTLAEAGHTKVLSAIKGPFETKQQRRKAETDALVPLVDRLIEQGRDVPFDLLGILHTWVAKVAPSRMTG